MHLGTSIKIGHTFLSLKITRSVKEQIISMSPTQDMTTLQGKTHISETGNKTS